MKSENMPLSVQLLAMSHSSHRNIAGFIKTKGKTHFTLSESENAQVIIIDIDNQEGRDLLSQLQPTQSHIIALALSPAEHIDSSIIQIKKPITSIELIRVAEKIKAFIKKESGVMNAKTTEANNNLKTSIKSAQKENAKVDQTKRLDESLSYDPKSTLQGMLRKAIQLSIHRHSSVLLHVQDYTIELNASDDMAYFNFPKNRLRSLCYIPLSASTCHIELGSLDEKTTENISLPITELSWNVAIQCARGRSPKPINDGILYHLKRWPNLTRWAVPNNALNIASLWTKSSYSISSISEQLSIPITDARCFITAALDSNLAVVSEENITSSHYKVKADNSTLFKKLLKRLKRD